MVEYTNPEVYASKFPGVLLKIAGSRPQAYCLLFSNNLTKIFGHAEGLGFMPCDREAIAASIYYFSEPSPPTDH